MLLCCAVKGGNSAVEGKEKLCCAVRGGHGAMGAVRERKSCVLHFPTLPIYISWSQ